jgi:hypothetical protein
VESEEELAELARLGRVTPKTPVYSVGDGPRALGEIPDLAGLVGWPVSSEPPIRLERRSPERAMLSEELAILDRPLDDDIEYYDAVPVRRWPRNLAILLALAAGALGAYFLVLPRFPSWRSSAMARLVLPARAWVGGTTPVRETPAPPAVAAVSAHAESAAMVAAPAVEPLPVVPAPAAVPPSDTPPSSVAENIGAPVADREAATTDVRKAGRPHRRHRSGNRAPTR